MMNQEHGAGMYSHKAPCSVYDSFNNQHKCLIWQNGSKILRR